jgi:hypothetical protein
MATKTREEIEALKENWRKDPCWDIEGTQEFEEHAEELLAYRLDVEAEAERKTQEQKARRAKMFIAETGVTDPVLADSLSSFSEIAKTIQFDPHGGAVASAILLLAAQVKRVADMYERHFDNLEADAKREEIRNLYRR